jgi:hypothetical protein
MASKYDWETIEKAYRTGKYSNRQLSKIHTASEAAIRNRAKKNEWKKDLSKPVNARIKDKLTAKSAQEKAEQEAVNQGVEPESMPRPSDEEIIEAAANTAASIVFQHRAYAMKGREITGLLLDKLKEQMEAGTIIVPQFGKNVEIDIPLDYIGKTLSAATQSLDRLVKIERQAFRLDDEEKDENPNEDLTDSELEKQIADLSSGSSDKS